MTRHLAKSLGLHADLFAKTPYATVFSRRHARQGGRPRHQRGARGDPEADRCRRGEGIYEGPVAAEIVEFAAGAGSPLASSDLTSYRVARREPIHAKWEGYEVVTMPAPSAGGVLLLESLALFSKAELVTMGMGTANYTHMLAEAMRGALGRSHARLG